MITNTEGKLMDFFTDDEKILSPINYQKTLKIIAAFRKGSLKCETKNFSGIKTIIWLRVSDNQKFHIEFFISKGKAKIVAVRKGRYECLAEANINTEISTMLGKGFHRIRLIGEQADIHLLLTKIA